MKRVPRKNSIHDNIPVVHLTTNKQIHVIQKNDDHKKVPEDDYNKEIDEFSKIVQKIENSMNGLKKTVEKLQQTQAESHACTSEHQRKMISKRIGDLLNDTSSTLREVKSSLQSIASETEELKKQYNQASAIIRIREQQHVRLTREFVSILREYHAIREESKEVEAQKLERQVRTVKPNATDEEVQEILEQCLDKGNIFKNDILTKSQASTVEAVYAEAQETFRDIQQLEQQFYEVHELFKDFALLVQQQDSTIDNILLSTQNAVDYVEKGAQNLQDAKKYQKKARGNCVMM